MEIESAQSSEGQPFLPAGLSSPPANITTSAVPSIVTPIVNGFTGIPHQPNGHPAVETVYTNGLSPYSTQSPTAADTLQQAFTGVQQYTGVRQGRLLSYAVLQGEYSAKCYGTVLARQLLYEHEYVCIPCFRTERQRPFD